MTLLKERLTEAMKNNEDITTYVWKGAKVAKEDGTFKQSTIKLVDMDAEQLTSCYEHCKTMLFNKDTQNPGRYLVLDTIGVQKDRCGAELFLRYVEQEHNMSRFNLVGLINTFLNTNKDVFKEKKAHLKDMFDHIPNEFENLPLNLIIDGCLDKLGAFNKKHITRTFILRQGIWLTPTESKELLGDDRNVDRLAVMKESLNIKEVENLYINSRGLNYTQMRAMLNLRPNKKYSDLTTMQLETLRNRILFDLTETVKNHIRSWEKRMEEIEKVAEHKNFKL